MAGNTLAMAVTVRSAHTLVTTDKLDQGEQLVLVFKGDYGGLRSQDITRA